MVVISINSVLMAVAVGLLGTLVRSGQMAQRHWTQTATSVRLAAQFRDDVAAAQQAKIVQDAAADGNGQLPNARRTTLKLLGPADRVVEFHRDGQHVWRIESRGELVLRRELYSIPKLAETVFSVPDDGHDNEDNNRRSSQFVTMKVRLAPGPGADGEAWQIVARLAKDLRFATGDRAHEEDEP